MADTTLSTILARFDAVLAAAPLRLKVAKDGFSHDRQPNTLLDGAYYVEDGGLVSSRPCGNYRAARIDRLVVYVAAKLKFDPTTAKRDMESTLLSVERYLKADGLSQSYHVEITGGRRVTRPKGGEFLIGSLPLTVDYDVNESTT